MTADALSRRVRRLGHLDLPGGGQVVVQGRHAFVGHMKPPHGTTIVDVEDPANPRVVATIPLPDARSHTHKVRVAGDVMITNVEMNNRHLLRRGAQRLVEAEARLAGTLGRPATDQELAAELKVKPGDIALIREFMPRATTRAASRSGTSRIKSKPRLLHHERTFGFGVHRFDMDERYAYISTEMEGYVGNILVIYDLARPERPVEVARW